MEKLFEIVKTEYYISKNIYSKPRTPLRKTKSYEIELYTTSGNTSVVNGVHHNQKISNILVAQPNDLRYSIGSFECYCVHFLCFDPAICTELNKLPKVFATSDIDNLKKIFKEIQNMKNFSGVAKTLFVNGKLLELISVLLAETEKEYHGEYERYLSEINYACEFIENNCERHIRLADISQEVSLSPGFFHTVFKTIKGVTPLVYLLNIRIDRAKSLLRKSNISLAEIAILCGFGSQGYFNYVFKSKTGLTPKEYRDKKQIII